MTRLPLGRRSSVVVVLLSFRTKSLPGAKACPCDQLATRQIAATLASRSLPRKLPCANSLRRRQRATRHSPRTQRLGRRASCRGNSNARPILLVGHVFPLVLQLKATCLKPPVPLHQSKLL